MSNLPPEKQQITISQAMADLQGTSEEQKNEEYNFEARFSQRRIEAEREYTNLNGLKAHYKHKTYWSWFLMVMMAFMVVFQIILISLIGSDVWDFTSYSWLVPTLMLQYLAQIVGLAIFVVKSLFKDMG